MVRFLHWPSWLLFFTSMGCFADDSVKSQTAPWACRLSFQALVEDEIEANFISFGKSTETFPISFSHQPLSAIEIEAAEGVPPELRNYFVQGDRFRWPQHPLNTFSGVPFYTAPSAGSFPGQHSASRSLFLTGSPVPASIKLPTDRPSRHVWDGNKAMLWEELALAVRRTNYLKARDRTLGSDPQITFLPEVLAIRDRSSGNGFLVRDLSPLSDGSTWMPAFSLPYRRPELLEKYSASMGRLKARLLIRYGIQLDQPHPQNFLLQLGPDGQPTGKIAIRDLSDQVVFVDWMAENIGAHDQVLKDRATTWNIPAEGIPFPPPNTPTDIPVRATRSVDVDSVIRPNFAFATMHYEKAMPTIFSRRRLVEAQTAQEKAYFEEFNSLLGLRVSPPQHDPYEAGRPGMGQKAGESERALRDLTQALRSDAGRVALRRYLDGLQRQSAP